VPGHPISRGTLCPLAFGAHQLPYHPARLKTPLHNGSPVSIDVVTEALHNRRGIAVLDEAPGRSASVVLSRFAEASSGTYFASGLASVPEGSLSVLVIDHGPLGGWLAWRTIKRKLAPNAVVVSITPFLAGVATRATYVVPAPAWLESTTDAATPLSYSVAPALLPRPPLPTFLGGEDEIRRSRVAALHKSGRGSIFLGESKPLAAFDSFDKLEAAFNEGACWTDPLYVPRGAAYQAARGYQPRSDKLTIYPPPPQPAVLPPLMCKLNRESNLQGLPDRVYVNPADARKLGLSPGDRVNIQAITLRVALDSNIAPGAAAVLDREVTDEPIDVDLVRI
jgi:hypothetical protein